MHDPKEFYLGRIRELQASVDALKQQGGRLSLSRLAVAAMVAGSIYLAATTSLHVLWLTLGLIIVFLRLVQRHLEVSGEVETVTTMARLCSDEIRLINGDPHVFDPGPSQVYQDHIYANDLDIFGTTSLFKAVNRTVTFEGRALMTDTLLNLPLDPDLIAKRREAIEDLAERVAWRQRFFATGVKSGETVLDRSAVAAWLDEPWFFDGRKYWLAIATVAALLSLAALIYMIVVGQFVFGLFIGVLTFNLTVLQAIARDLKSYFNQFGSRTTLFRKFSEMVNLAIAEPFESALGRDLGGSLADAAPAFLRLSRLYNMAEQRANQFVAFVGNGLLMIDVWTVFRIEAWRLKHRQATMPWIRALGSLDMLSSCSNFRFNHPTFCNPVIEPAAPFIRALALAHPLIPVNDAVANDYEIGMNVKSHVITGSNMAGKSTFIRAVGLNVVLALNGLPVCAKEFSCPAMRIASCIRITDSLEDHASYFKAELDRLRTILDLLVTGDSYLVLLDEILRGTNSDDKHEGTLLFFQKLETFNCVSLLATHDLSIGRLEQDLPGRFANYCFESHVEGSELVFDYKLKRGISKSANATFLMRQLRLID
jgi:hypothetical protein